MKTLHIALASFVLSGAFGAGAASAQGRYDRYGYHPPTQAKVDIRQSGRGNGAAVSQTGAANAAGVSQDGVNNTGHVVQTGSGNDATIRQLGRSNEATITQTGANNAACIVQIGKNLSTGIVQEGDSQSRGVVQTKKGTYDFPAQLCAIDPTGKGYWQRIGVKGY